MAAGVKEFSFRPYAAKPMNYNKRPIPQPEPTALLHPNSRGEAQRREGFRSYARQSVVEFAETELATIHRLAIRRGGLTSNVPKKANK